MSDEAYSSPAARRADRETSGWAVGLILFAAIMMIMAGVFQALEGLIAIFQNEFYVPPATTSSSSTPPPGAGST
jgi:hypothetical protein